MTFGKYRGRHINDVPVDYLQWCINNIDFKDRKLEQAIEDFLDELDDPKPEYSDKDHHEELLYVVNQWYKKAALELHPDRGGNVIAMRLVNELVHELRERLSASFSQ